MTPSHPHDSLSPILAQPDQNSPLPSFQSRDQGSQCSCQILDQGKLIDDFYSSEHQQFIFYSVNNRYPNHILNNQTTERQYKKKRICQNKRFYKIKKCPRNRYHIISTKCQRQAPMLIRTLHIMKNLHKNHDGYQTLSINAGKSLIYHPNQVRNYCFKYVKSCSHCSIKDQTGPCAKAYNRDIFEDINQALQLNLDLNQIHDSCQVKFDYQECLYDCTKDKYSGDQSVIFDLFTEKISMKQLSFNKNQKKKYQRQLRSIKIKRCTRGTPHMWRLRKNNIQSMNSLTKQQIQANLRRVPLDHEKYIVANQLHGNNHRSKNRMLHALTKTRFSYVPMKDYIENNFDYCDQCKKSGKYGIQCNKKYNKDQQQEKKQEQEDQQGHIQWRKHKLKNNNEENQPNYYNYKQSPYQEKKYRKSTQKYSYQMQLDYVVETIEACENSDSLIVKYQRQDEQQLKAIILSTAVMQNNYFRYGDCIYFETFSGFLKHGNLLAPYFVTGVTQRGKPVLFGVIIIAQSSSQCFYRALIGFFQLMYKEYPKTLYTTLNLNLQIAISSLPFYFNDKRLLQMKHIISRKSIAEYIFSLHPYDNQILQDFIKAMKTQSDEDFKKFYKKIQNFFQDDEDKKWFKQISLKCCEKEIGPHFYGMAFDQKRQHNALRLIKQNFTPDAKLTVFIRNIIQIQDVNNYDYQIPGIPYNLNYIQLCQLQTAVSEHIFFQICDNFLSSFSIYSMKFINSCNIRIVKDNQEWNLTYSLQSQHWRCCCQTLEKKGIPCCHLIRVLINFRASLLYYINSRWLINENHLMI